MLVQNQACQSCEKNYPSVIYCMILESENWIRTAERELETSKRQLKSCATDHGAKLARAFTSTKNADILGTRR